MSVRLQLRFHNPQQLLQHLHRYATHSGAVVPERLCRSVAVPGPAGGVELEFIVGALRALVRGQAVRRERLGIVVELEPESLQAAFKLVRDGDAGAGRVTLARLSVRPPRGVTERVRPGARALHDQDLEPPADEPTNVVVRDLPPAAITPLGYEPDISAESDPLLEWSTTAAHARSAASVELMADLDIVGEAPSASTETPRMEGGSGHTPSAPLDIADSSRTYTLPVEALDSTHTPVSPDEVPDSAQTPVTHPGLAHGPDEALDSARTPVYVREPSSSTHTPVTGPPAMAPSAWIELGAVDLLRLAFTHAADPALALRIIRHRNAGRGLALRLLGRLTRQQLVALADDRLLPPFLRGAIARHLSRV